MSSPPPTGTAALAPVATVTEYCVSCLPLDHPAAAAFTVRVSWRGRGKWAVIRHGDCYDRAGRPSHERLASARRDEWLSEHRFDLDTALEIAITVAPSLTVNGHTVADALSWRNNG